MEDCGLADAGLAREQGIPGPPAPAADVPLEARVSLFRRLHLRPGRPIPLSGDRARSV